MATYTESILNDVAVQDFGSSADIDGDYAVVGEEQDDGVNDGTAHIYYKTGGAWGLQDSVDPSDGAAEDGFGSAVAISGDTIVVGSPYHDIGADAGIGAAYVYTRTGAVWSQQQKLTASDGAAGDRFGLSVSIDGDTIAVGAEGVGTWAGKVYVFTRTAGVWSEEDNFAGSGTVNNSYFGNEVDLANDGDDLIVGQPLTAPLAYIFTRTAGVWSEQQCLTNPGASTNYFGYAVTIADNDRCVVGAPQPYNSPQLGKAYVYTRSTAGVWSPEATLSASDESAADSFGAAIAVNDYWIIVGASGNDDNGAASGAAYLFAGNSDGEWDEVQKLIASDAAAGDSFGGPHEGGVAVDANNALIICARGGDAAYIYDGWEFGAAPDYTKEGQHFNIYLLIDGLEPVLWQYSWRGPPLGWDRSIKTCLNSATGGAADLDLGTMKAGMDAMTFVLEDIKNSDGTSYFGQLFAPGRFNSAAHSLVKHGADYNQVVAADATTIPVNGDGANISTGINHMGQEAIKVGAVAATELTSVTRGMFPGAGDEFGRTIPRPLEDGPGYQVPISPYPYSWVGRRIFLYGVQWHEDAASWTDRENAELLWPGRISDRIVQRGDTRQWELSCTSILGDLGRKKIAAQMPEGTLDEVINLQGQWGKEWQIRISGGGVVSDLDIGTDIGQGIFTPDGLMTAMNTSIAVALGTLIGTAPIQIAYREGKYRLVFQAGGTGTVTIRVRWYSRTNSKFCHAMHALGFGPTDHYFELDATTTEEYAIEGGDYYVAYQPLAHGYHGNRLYVLPRSARFWTDQGDNRGASSSSAAAVMLPDAYLSTRPEIKGDWHVSYDGKFSSTLTNEYLELEEDYRVFYHKNQVKEDGFVGQKSGDDPVAVKQVYIPRYETTDNYRHYPFQMLLYPLLSTGGQSGYNDDDYDYLPPELSVGIQASLVDINSFTNADLQIKNSDLAVRDPYVITEAVSWLDLAAREGQLFGYAVVWRRGKLTVVDVLHPEYDEVATIVNQDTPSKANVWPDIDMSIDTVLNQYKLSVAYDIASGKYGRDIIVRDMHSVFGLETTKETEIKHPGVSIPQGINLGDYFGKWLSDRWLGQPNPVVRVSLTHSLINKIFVGDIVWCVSDRIPDPAGGGLYECAVLATVLNVSWEYGEHLYTGSATLILHSLTAVVVDVSTAWTIGTLHDIRLTQPWSAAAAVDRAKDGGNWDKGWSDTDDQLALEANAFGETGDLDDGARWRAGFFVNVIERAPADPTNPLEWGPFEVASDYETDGDGILTLVASTMAGWDGSKEYIVVHADYGSCSTAQLLEGAWQADSDTRLLNAATKAQRYG